MFAFRYLYFTWPREAGPPRRSMFLKATMCRLLKFLGMHPFECERCSVTSDCEGRLMRERLQELCCQTKPKNAPAVDDAA